jgi:hypothetical protein
MASSASATTMMSADRSADGHELRWLLIGDRLPSTDAAAAVRPCATARVASAVCLIGDSTRATSGEGDAMGPGGFTGPAFELLALCLTNVLALVGAVELLSLERSGLDGALVGSAVVFKIGRALVLGVGGAVLSRVGVLDRGSDVALGAGAGRTPRGLGSVVSSRPWFRCRGCVGCPGRALAGAASATIVMSAIAVAVAPHAVTHHRR